MKRFYLETDWKDENGERLEIINDPEPIAAIKIENRLLEVYDENGRVNLEVITKLEVDEEDDLGERVNIISTAKFNETTFKVKTPINIVTLGEIVYQCIKDTEDISDNISFCRLLNENIKHLAKSLFNANQRLFVANTDFDYQVEALSNDKIFGIANSYTVSKEYGIILNDFVSSVDVENVKQPIILKLYNGHHSFDVALSSITLASCEDGLSKVLGAISSITMTMGQSFSPSEDITDRASYSKEKLKYIKDKKSLDNDISFLEDLFI